MAGLICPGKDKFVCWLKKPGHEMRIWYISIFCVQVQHQLSCNESYVILSSSGSVLLSPPALFVESKCHCWWNSFAEVFWINQAVNAVELILNWELMMCRVDARPWIVRRQSVCTVSGFGCEHGSIVITRSWTVHRHRRVNNANVFHLMCIIRCHHYIVNDNNRVFPPEYYEHCCNYSAACHLH